MINKMIEIIKSARIDNLYLQSIGVDTSKKNVPCPIHKGQDNNFQIDITNSRYTCHSHECVRSGDIINVCMAYEGLNTFEACKFLAEKYNIELPNLEYTEEQKKEYAKAKKLEVKKQALLEENHKKQLEHSTDFQALLKDFEEEEGINNMQGYGTLLHDNYYYDGENIILVKQTKDGEETEIVVSGFLDILEAEQNIDENTEKIRLKSKQPNCKEATLVVAKGELFDSSYHKILNNKSGFLIEPNLRKATQNYIVSRFKFLRNKNQLKNSFITNKIGWVTVDKISRFVYPNSDVMLDEIQYNSEGSYNVKTGIKGNLLDYVEQVLLPLLEGVPGLIAFSGAIASLLLEPLGVTESFLIDIYGKNGKGKSTLQKAVASMFGYYDKYFQSWKGTSVGLLGLAVEAGNFPLILDDTKNLTDKKQAVDLVYTFATGKEKTRGTKEGGVKESKEFKNIQISSGEATITSLFGGDNVGAGAYGRLVSIDINQYPVFITETETEGAKLAKSVENGFKNNYGIFGRDFCRWLVNEFKNIEYIEILKEKLEAIEADFNTLGLKHSSSIRRSKHTAILQLAYNLLSDFLINYNIEIQNKDEVFKNFLIENDKELVTSDPYVKSYEASLEWINVNINKFYTNSKPFAPSPMYGWVKDDKAYILAKEDLYNILEKFQSKDDILREWRDRNYIECKSGKLTKQCKNPITGKQVYVHIVNLNITNETNPESNPGDNIITFNKKTYRKDNAEDMYKYALALRESLNIDIRMLRKELEDSKKGNQQSFF